MNRRLFMTLSAAGLATRSWIAVRRALALSAARKAHIKALAFDAFPIFDPRPVFDLAEELFPGTVSAMNGGRDSSNTPGCGWPRITMQISGR
jgi:2-haloacid dehalogenase